MFKCKVCDEKDKRIADLISQVDLFRKMALPSAHTIEIPFAAREVDRILSGSDEPIDVTTEEEIREVSALLTGNYDNSQVDFD